MKSDIDAFMQANEIDALLVVGPGQHNPAMVYLTGGAHLTGADLVKKRGEPGVLFYHSMERDEAARAAERMGLRTRGYNDYPYAELLKQAEGDRVAALALLYQRMLADLGIAGRVALYGQGDLRVFYPIMQALQQQVPGITLIGDLDNAVLGGAMATKDADEIERIRAMGKITTGVVGQVADYLSSQAVRGDMLLRPDGEPLTIGHVKGLINLWLAERGAENPEGTIFAIGHDAGVPHSTGNAADPLRLGQTIVFDIFPCEAGGGYFYDFTRTWCLGHATDEVLRVYEDVAIVFHTIMAELQSGEHFGRYQQRTCELFEGLGHTTIASDPQTEEGYVHSLGHGLGLRVHERPSSGKYALPMDRLDPGVVMTIEPGLYYPSRGLGVRLEDTVWVRPDGQMEVLAEYPLDLVLPVKQ